MKTIFTIFLSVLSLLSFAQTDWDKVEIKTINLTENISYLQGAGGNIGVLYGKDGIMIIDDQYAQLSDKIKEAISNLSDGELKFIVNTHYHGDHTGGNENMSANGALIVAQQNVRKRLGISFHNDLLNRDMEAKPESYWPKLTFSESINFYFDDEDVQVTFVPNAHTDGDALVYFKNNNVLHTGDTFVRYGFPFIDIAAGGSIDGFIAALDKILEIANADTKIIPGHGELSTIEEVKELRKMMVETRKIIADLKAKGKTLNECEKAKPLAAYSERWSGHFITTDTYIMEVYESLK